MLISPRVDRAPGLALVVAATAVGQVLGRLVPVASPLVVGIVLGVAWRFFAGNREPMTPGLRFAATWLLRAGVMLLGLQLAVTDVVHFGLPVLTVVLASVAGGFFATLWSGRVLGLSPPRRLLVATGVSICGASAVAAANSVADGSEEDVATAVTTVTLLGTLAIAVFPAVAGLLGLTDAQFGIWTGTSVHEVGQVVAIGGAAGAAVLQAAVVIKLTRVVLLAPVVALTGLHRRRSGARPPLVPWFVAGFVVLAAVRATGMVPAPVTSTVQLTANLLLCAGMFGLGAAVDLRAVLRTGGRALAAAGLGSLALATLALTGTVLVSP
ncbi:MAG TPA: putative sulfate exporter family transporter [Actinophytocola sp.]|nr:putative sulfate exporter family transporter [Actinophytocola sp.]